MGYIQEASSWRTRQRHRQQITLVVVLVVLLVTGGVSYAVYSGAIGGDDGVDVTALPPCPSTKPPVKPEQVVVNVYNATTRNGLAAKTATTLSLRRFAVKTVANDPRHEKVAGTAIIRFGPKGKAYAQLLAKHVRTPKMVADKRKTATVDLVLGAKFTALVPLATATATPTTQPTCRPVTPTTATSTSATSPGSTAPTP